MARLWSWFCVACSVLMISRLCTCDFATEQLGNYVSDEEYKNQSKCWTKVCMRDSGRLIYSASHDSVKINPCDDFPTFAMGEFLEHRVPNERYAKLGFRSDIEAQFFEKQKRILQEPVKVDAPTMFKVVKSFFKKCINSAAIISRGPSDMLSYMKRLNLPLTSDEWDEKSFEVQSLFNFDPDLAFSLFFDLQVVRCDDKLCGNAVDIWKFNQNSRNDTLNIFKNLKANKKSRDELVSDLVNFLEAKLIVQDKYFIENAPSYEQPFDMNEDLVHRRGYRRIIKEYLTQLGFNKGSKVRVLYPKFPLLHKLAEIFEQLPKRKIANIFTAAFVQKYQKAFIVYSFTKQEENFFGTKRSYQRFEQCVQFVEKNMKQAFEALLAEKLFDKSVQAAARQMAEEAIADSQMLKKGEYDTFSKSVKLSVMFSDDATNITRVNQVYEELKLDGSESFVEMYIETERFRGSFKQTALNSDAASEFDFELKNLEYRMHIPVKWTLYPSFHPHRPRFFNTASFYREVLRLIKQISPIEISPIDVAYKSYSDWLNEGNLDLRLPAFKMTSRQMFWLSAVHVITEKYQIGVSKTFELAHQLTNKYLHVILKNKKEFRDDFKCGEMTANEIQLFEEFQKKTNYLTQAISFRNFCGNCHIRQERFIEMKESGLFEFTESVLKDPMYANNLEVMKELMKENRWTNANLAKVFSSVCPTKEGCAVFL